MKRLVFAVSVGMILLISLACVIATSQAPTPGINSTRTPTTGATPAQDLLPKPTVTLPPEPTVTTDHGVGHIVFESCKNVSSLGNGMDCGISIMNADGSGMRQITNFDGDTQPSLSPDGTRVAFVSSARDGNYEIYVIGTDGSGLARLTTNPGMDLQPSWSPDGSQIIYTSSLGITIMGADGSNPHPISNIHGSFPRWSPDGLQILFVTGDSENVIKIMDADGTHAQVINTNPAFLIRSPVMSPDGSKIAFLTQRNRDALVEVDIIDIDGKNQHSLTDGYQLTYGGLSWSPDGQQLIFTMNGDGMSSQGFPPAQLFFVNADGSDLHKLNETCSYCVWADWGH